MKIIQTKIIDQNSIDDSAASKLMLFDDLFSYFSPLFYEDLEKKQKQLTSNITDIKDLKEAVSAFKIKISRIKFNFDKEILKKEILVEIQSLIHIGVIYGKIKTEITEILKTIDNQKTIELKKSLMHLRKMRQEKQKKGDK